MRKLSIFYVAFVIIWGMQIDALAGGPVSDPRCDGLSGAAFGLCRAAIAVGCDDPTTNTPGCAAIEENFSQITGEDPPWTESCPCWSVNELYSISSNYLDFYCQDNTGNTGPVLCTDVCCGDYCCVGKTADKEFGPLRIGSKPFGCYVWSDDNPKVPTISIEDLTEEEYIICAKSLEPYM